MEINLEIDTKSLIAVMADEAGVEVGVSDNYLRFYDETGDARFDLDFDPDTGDFVGVDFHD